MKKNKKFIYILFVLIMFCSIIIIPNYISASFDLSSFEKDFKSPSISDSDLMTEFDPLIKTISDIGSVISVIALICIGIKYIMGSVEEKAEYKQTMTPYLIGATFVFAISRIIRIIQELVLDITGANDVISVGGKVITLLSVIGSLLSVIVLVAIGIKYMMGSVEEKATYKKTLMPYIIGAIVVFAASNLAGMVYNIANQF